MTAATVMLLIDQVPTSDYEAPTVRATIETVMTLLAFGGAWLVRTQFGHSRRLRDLLLFGTLLMLGLTTLFAHALPAALDLRPGDGFGVLALSGGLLVAIAFAAAASTPPERLIAGGRPVALVAILSLVGIAAAALVGLLLTSGQFVATAGRPKSGLFSMAEYPFTLIFRLPTTALLIYGAVVLTSRDRFDPKSYESLLAGGAILLAAVSAFNVGLPERVAPLEAIRLLGYGLLLTAVVRQELRIRKSVAQAAAMAERRRVAQDLHDGLAQDLAFIAAHGARMSAQHGDEHPVAIAARRALAASRSTIAELSDPSAVTAQEALDAIAYELRDRFEIGIAVHAELGDEIALDARDQMTRIAREAIANAARHGGAKNVIVSLTHSYRGLVLRVIDDGSGMATTSDGAAPEGFGLQSMSERAASLGGQLTVRQPRKRGTELEVLVP
jgi:signal transduction histidine kinase